MASWITILEKEYIPLNLEMLYNHFEIIPGNNNKIKVIYNKKEIKK